VFVIFEESWILLSLSLLSEKFFNTEYLPKGQKGEGETPRPR